MTFTASAPGTDRLASSLSDAAAALLDLDEANDQAGDYVLGYVNPPVRTGRLAGTVREESDALGFTLTAGGPSAPYTPIVHAHDPFLTRALDDQQQVVTDTYIDHAHRAADLIQGD